MTGIMGPDDDNDPSREKKAQDLMGGARSVPSEDSPEDDDDTMQSRAKTDEDDR
jgi:hypothetical protein